MQILDCCQMRARCIHCRYFYATLHLGTPPKQFAVIVDTGSTITYVPCASCGRNCGPHHKVCPCPSSCSGLPTCCAPKVPLRHCMLSDCKILTVVGYNST